MTPSTTVSHFIRNLLAALAGFVLAAWALRALGPVPTAISLDRERVARERETCQILFVGPSYVAAQIEPRVFDEAAAELGHSVHSCKFGGRGLRSSELRVHLQELLELDWPRLSLVVIDVTLGPEPRFDEVNWYTPRLIQWHTWESARWIIEYYRDADRDASARLLAAHLLHLAANYANLGNGSEAFSVSDAVSAYASMLRRRDGVEKEQGRAYLARTSREEHDRRVADLIRRKREERNPQGSVDASWLAGVRRSVREHGHEAIFIQAPVWRALPARMQEPEPEDPLVFLDFDDPERYPDLYDRKSRGLTHHLSWHGSRAYSRLLAREIVEVWELP